MQVVITEAELKRFTDVDELLIPDNAVVTPTAWDYARDYGIRLVREGEPHKVRSRAVYHQEPGYSVHPIYRERVKSTRGPKGRSVVKYACQETGRPPIQDGLYRTIERILEVAVARLGSSVEPEILVTIVIRTLTRLGYDVVMSKGGEPG